MNKFDTYVDYLSIWIKERSTWQAIGFLAGMLISKELGDLDWGAAAALGGAISATVKLARDK